MIKKVIWCVFVGFLALSCLDEPDCFNLNNDIVGFSFQKILGGADSVEVVSIQIEGTDSVFKAISPTSFRIPINYLRQEAVITINWIDVYKASQRDTIILSYSAKAQYVSEDCGERYIVSNLGVIESHYSSDSTRVVSASPGTETSKTTNILLYRCPITNFVKFSFRQLYADEDSVGRKMNVALNNIMLDYTGEIYYQDALASDYKLPLNTATSNTAFSFNFPNGSGDISLSYDKQDTILIGVCGVQSVYKKLAITGNDFGESLMLLRDSVEDPAVTNILIRRCPDTHLMKVSFKAALDISGTKSENLQQVSAIHFTEDLLFENPVRELTLPLDSTSNTSTFTFVFADASMELSVSYNRSQEVFHEFCDQTVITNLQITASEFSDEDVLDSEIKYPTVTNIALVKN